jgi:hypothetical protein
MRNLFYMTVVRIYAVYYKYNPKEFIGYCKMHVLRVGTGNGEMAFRTNLLEGLYSNVVSNECLPHMLYTDGAESMYEFNLVDEYYVFEWI